MKPVMSKLFPSLAPFTMSVSPANVFDSPKMASGLVISPPLGAAFTMKVSLPDPP